MNRRSLAVLAIIIIVLMGVVAVAGLDNLPRRLRTQVEAAQSRLKADSGQLEENKAFVERALRDEPQLFRTRAAALQERLKTAQARLAAATAELAVLEKLKEANRRADAEAVEQGLARLQSARTAALKEVDDARVEAARWIQWKRELPARLASMERSYEAVKGFDVAAATGPASKAASDWPAKKQDIEARIAALNTVKADAERAWESSAEVRRQAAAEQHDALDYAALFQAADSLDNAARQLKEGSDGLNRLTAQLYESWDKLLLESDDDRRRVRLVRTKYADPSLNNPQVSQEERWEPGGRIRDAERKVGMVVERKPAGKYDSEAEATAQEPAYAYIAPPGQANAYGSWQNGVWTWLPQYLILSQLLRAGGGGGITSGDWTRYDSARRRGDVWYGHRSERPDRGWSSRAGDLLRRGEEGWERRDRSRSSGGGWYKERETPTFGNRRYSDSQYRSRGSFSGSRYQSRGGGFGMRSYSRGFGGGRISRGRR